MRELSIWCDSHAPPRDLGVFKSAAELHEAATVDTVESVSSGCELLECLASHTGENIDHLVIAGHGGPTWVLDDEYGVTTGTVRHEGQVHVHQVAQVLHGVMAKDGLISLAACLCSRSPAWFLQWKYGRQIGSDWGRRAYLPGGEASLSARIRDFMWWNGSSVRVRGHRAAGHATALALLAEHSGSAGAQCSTLFQRALPCVEPNLHARRWWVRTVTGDLACRWLMGDDRVESEIRAMWEMKK